VYHVFSGSARIVCEPYNSPQDAGELIMIHTSAFTKHASLRAVERQIPLGIIDLILEFGECIKARSGTRKYGLAGKGLKAIRQIYGQEIAKAVNKFRSACVIEADGKIITVVFEKKPLFN
jgi:hypothetical protein